MARRISGALVGHDSLVLERESRLLGYAYASRFRERSAYRFATETTIYLAPEVCRQGLGAPLYRTLLDRIASLGYRHAIGGIALPNEPSVRLHEKLGFVK